MSKRQPARAGSDAGIAGPTKPAAAIITPTVDLLLVGGLSLLLFVPLLLSGRSDLVIVGAGAQAWLATTINMPHFMASYRIVYRSRDMIMRHKWASIYVPAILIAYCALALWRSPVSLELVTLLVAVASGYLAWHYTGQVWGMMASFAYLEGQSFDKSERFLVRTGLRILLVWHLVWFLVTQLRNSDAVRPLYTLISAGTVVAFVLGGIGLAKMRRRTGKIPPTRAVVAWMAIFVWYAMMARDPRAIFWVQIAHALQYLAFPIRVEINRAKPKPAYGKVAYHLVLYGAGILAVSYVLSQLLPARAMDVVADMFGEEPGKAVPILLLMVINIHHYFTDGVIWKISNPEVRKELFAHVQPAGKGAAPSAEGSALGTPDYSPMTRKKKVPR